MSRTLSQLESEQKDQLVAVCMSNSYPTPGHTGMRVADNLDWGIWRGAQDTFSFRFGDYAASSRKSELSSFVPRNFKATVVHSLNEQWLIHRDVNQDDPNGWSIGANAIIDLDESNLSSSWADALIANVAANGIDGHDRPREWHAVRVNGHLERQVSYAFDMYVFGSPDD